LQLVLERVLVLVRFDLYFGFQLCQALHKVNGRLLVACGRRFEDVESAVELDCFLVVFQETQCHSRIERYAGKAVVDIRCPEPGRPI
jgi:hypothetical protein